MHLSQFNYDILEECILTLKLPITTIVVWFVVCL